MFALLSAIALVFVLADARAQTRQIDKSNNVDLLWSFNVPGATDDFDSATDLAFDGRYAYMGRWNTRESLGEVAGGVYIFDLAGAEPRKISFFPCPGGQHDVAIVRPGILALGSHQALCGAQGGGVTFIDVRNPRRPLVVGAIEQEPRGTHTLTVYPGTELVYASPATGADNTTGADEYIIDASNPRRPRLVATFDPQVIGCHDVSFRITKKEKLGFCAAGKSMTQIWDVSDPLAPRIVGRIVNPAISYHHTAVATPDGEFLVIGDEVFNAECSGGPTGSLWIYDIRNRTAPTLAGHYDVARGEMSLEPFTYTCEAHNFNFFPSSRLLVTAWDKAGMNVLDLADPANPKEVAYFMGPDSLYWSAYAYRGRIYASGIPGLDVFRVSGLPRESG